MVKNIHKALFYLLVFLIPLNLGKHYVFAWSYVRGLLVDYRVPVIYVTDVILFTVLLLWVLSFNKSLVRRLLSVMNDKGVVLLLFFLFSLILSALGSEDKAVSFYSAGKHFLYAGLFFYVLLNFDTKIDFSILARIFGISVLLVSLLAFAQWYSQGSVFDNYLFFGEQPYMSSTPGIVKESYFGRTVIPPYGTFRHPNVFAGFLAVGLLWLLTTIPESKFSMLAFGIGFIALVLTFSTFTWVVFLLGLLALWGLKKYGGSGRKVIVAVLLASVAVLMALPLFLDSPAFSETRSLSRRASMLLVNYQVIKDNLLFGTGPANTYKYADEWRFIQPVHNVPVLIFAESGVFAFLSFSGLICIALKRSLKYPLLFIMFSLILLVSLFDHFFYTINQTQLLFWLTLGVLFTYNLKQ